MRRGGTGGETTHGIGGGKEGGVSLVPSRDWHHLLGFFMLVSSLLLLPTSPLISPEGYGSAADAVSKDVCEGNGVPGTNMEQVFAVAAAAAGLSIAKWREREISNALQFARTCLSVEITYQRESA